MFASQPERIGTAQGRIEESSRSGWIGGVLASLCLVWLALTGALVYLSSAWAEPQLEIYIGGGLLAVLFFLKRLDSEQRLPHLLFLAISSVIVLRYLFWRVLYTIEFNDWLSFTCAVILFAAELYGIIVFFIGCFINASPITRSPAPLPPPIELSTVDVLVPSYNESSFRRNWMELGGDRFLAGESAAADPKCCAISFLGSTPRGYSQMERGARFSGMSYSGRSAGDILRRRRGTGFRPAIGFGDLGVRDVRHLDTVCDRHCGNSGKN
jgi:hypothetical protein